MSPLDFYEQYRISATVDKYISLRVDKYEIKNRKVKLKVNFKYLPSINSVESNNN